MIKVDAEQLKQKKALLAGLDADFNQWRPHFLEIAKLILPRRYQWLMSETALIKNATKTPATNTYILDPTATNAARILANGMMNGVTSPARPWFRLRLKEFPEDQNYYPKEYVIWLEEAKRRMEIILAESNYYNSQAVQYLELVGFGTGAMLLYDDFDDVIRCYNSPMGEYRLFQDHRRAVVGMARHFNLTVKQLVDMFGIDNVSEPVRAKYKVGGAGWLETVPVDHLIEPNDAKDGLEIAKVFKFREFYWETNNSSHGNLLRQSGYREKPIVAPRWEVTGNDTYGTSPTMDTIPDIKQLQLETKQKAQGMDKMIRPPVIADVALRQNPTALLPGGLSYVTNASSFGAKPIYTVNPPVGEISKDIQNLQLRIREGYYNHLFRNISQLDTVRSAAEVYERKSEDMLMLGGILERFQREALDPVIQRTFKIMFRKGLFPDPPPGLDPSTLDVQYVSILADAQRAAGTQSTERFLQLVGEVGASQPSVLNLPDYDELIRSYAQQLNVPANGIKSRAQVQEEAEAEAEQLEMQNAALVGNELTQATKNLSDSDVGGGQNALEAMLGA